jgi:primase-polymerase (primpol)-like protein
MKYINWFKGLALIALACSLTAEGSTFMSAGSKDNLQKTNNSKGYQIAVSTGEVKNNNKASANLTISGENSKVSVETAGTVTVVAGESIVLHPGTKISAGSFLYASIESAVKTVKHHKKDVKLVTVEENKKIEEQASLAFAANLFSPFPSSRKGTVHAGDAENGSFTASNNVLLGVSPEQQRKVAVDSRLLPQVSPKQILTVNHTTPVSYAYRAQIMMVLRL